MSIKSHIPNLITLLNLLSGVIAVFYAVFGQLELAGVFVVIGIVFDFFDGFSARILHVQGDLGKQLDSLADMVTSGVVPGIILFQLLLRATSNSSIESVFQLESFEIIPFIGFLVILASAYRLAKFNIDTRQSDSFIGLPTPANTLIIISLPWIIAFSNLEFFTSIFSNVYFLIALTLICSYLLNAEIPLFALKFKNFSWKDNEYKFVFLGTSIVMLVTIQFIAIPLIILLYVLVSVWNNKRSK
ncbi:CDP-alcohol phosphatidyltransferase family protein [Flavicella sp.]|uniref:CDP-alcohol phosphatidyltransferase family protein n=1 Tax=Flavicella sp. TaxID=2957742 RepID=UPI0030183E10